MSSPEDAFLAGHVLEPELTGPTPRSIPQKLSRGPYALRRRTLAAGLTTAGVISIALSLAPWNDVLSLYVLPFAHLDWIGLGMLLVAGVLHLDQRLQTGPYRYVRHGVPVPARVAELIKAPSSIVNGQATHHAFTAVLELEQPESGNLVQFAVRSNEFSSSSKDRYDTPFRVNDVVTAVYLPGKFEKTLQVYAFLDLSPDACLQQASPRAESPLQVVGLVLVLALLFVALFGNVYIYGRFHPIDFAYRQASIPMTVGGLLLGGGVLAGLYWLHRKEQQRVAEASERALADGSAFEVGAPFLGGGAYGWFVRVVLFIGAPLLGAATALSWCFLANALLDRSAPQPMSATVTDMTMTTHAFMFREYELEYRLEGDAKARKLLTTPGHLSQFDGVAAIAHVGQGRFGWRWVQNVTPLRSAP